MANMPYKGDNIGFSWVLEGTYDQTPTAGQVNWFGVVANADLNSETEYKDHYTVNSDQDLFLEVPGKRSYTGSVPIDFQTGKFVHLAMGAETFLAGTPNTHTLTASNRLPSIVIEAVYKGTNSFLRYYTGVKVDSLTIEGAEGGELKANMAWKAARGFTSTNSASTVSSVTSRPLMFHDAYITLGASAYDITSFKWTVKRNSKPVWTVRQTGGQDAYNIIEGKREYELAGQMIIPDAATYNTYLYDQLMSGTTFTAVVNIARTAASDDIVLTCSNCTVRSAPHNIPEVGEEVRVDFVLKPRVCGFVIHDQLGTYSV